MAKGEWKAGSKSLRSWLCGRLDKHCATNPCCIVINKCIATQEVSLFLPNRFQARVDKYWGCVRYLCLMPLGSSQKQAYLVYDKRKHARILYLWPLNFYLTMWNTTELGVQQKGVIPCKDIFLSPTEMDRTFQTDEWLTTNERRQILKIWVSAANISHSLLRLQLKFQLLNSHAEIGDLYFTTSNIVAYRDMVRCWLIRKTSIFANP